MPIYVSNFMYIYIKVFLPGEVKFPAWGRKFSQAGRGIFSGKQGDFHK